MKEITEKEFSEFEKLADYRGELEKFPPTERVTFNEFLLKVRKDGMLRAIVGYGLTRLAIYKDHIPIFLSFWSLYSKDSLVIPSEILDMMYKSDKTTSILDYDGELNIDYILNRYTEVVYGINPLSNISDKTRKKILSELWKDDEVFKIKDAVYILSDSDRQFNSKESEREKSF
jgi:hypothetical protein